MNFLKKIWNFYRTAPTKETLAALGAVVAIYSTYIDLKADEKNYLLQGAVGGFAFGWFIGETQKAIRKRNELESLLKVNDPIVMIKLEEIMETWGGRQIALVAYENLGRLDEYRDTVTWLESQGNIQELRLPNFYSSSEGS